MRRALFLLFLASVPVFLSGQGKPLSTKPHGSRPQFVVAKASIPEMQAAMRQGRVTSRDLVLQYLIRIALYNRSLNAIITVNRNALRQAEQLDRERASGHVRGPLHGIPIALKDNIHTTDMPTTGGALAFNALVPPYEATVTRNLRDAGAVILVKTTMTELANWVAGDPTPMPGGYNALVGFSMNPYDPRRDPRDATFDGRPVLGTGGSSSGVGTAANLWAANVGTETSGSILSPANQNMLVGIKPTVGRVSRHGIIPITADQDTAGPMAKSVTDAAILLGALEGAKPDPDDPATTKCAPPPGRDYTRFLKPDGLKGARIGIPRAFYYDPITPPGEKEPRGGLDANQRKVMAEAIEVLKQRGAVVVDPADIPSVVSADPERNLLKWNTCSGVDNAKGKDDGCSIVFKYGMKRDFNKWLDSLGASAPVKSLTELRKFNLAHTAAGAIKFGQSQLDISDEMNLEQDRERYAKDRAKDLELAGAQGIDAALKEKNLDALLFPAATGAAIAAKPGYPTVIVPFGMVPNEPKVPFPEGFNAKPAPFGVSFTGTACSEPRLIELAFGFEQATKRRVPPMTQ
ncbi:MAG TPA: amidase family protein [Bryobacteraceae bacterium]|nr:amidase family protein [Bryobacteraceae bacterium]